MNRRTFLTAGASAAAATALSRSAFAQTQGFAVGPEPIRYPSSVWKVLDDRFNKYMIGNTPLVREWTGGMWAEGPAWNGVGRYVVFSDIPNNVQLRWDEVTGKVTQLRTPSNFSNGNTFDYQGRQISCEHQTARVVRYEYQGEPTVLASTYDGKRLNAPNDAIVHPNGGGILFTDPGYGSHFVLRGHRPRARAADERLPHRSADGAPDEADRRNPEAERALCFSPDHRYVYVADTAPTHHPKEKAKLIRWEVQDNGRRLTNRREFAVLDAGFHDGIRADVDGNIWCGTGFGGEGIDGVHVYAPDGKKIGQIVMPEGTANLCFVGRNRNRLFMTSSQSVYTLYTAAQGAHIT